MAQAKTGSAKARRPYLESSLQKKRTEEPTYFGGRSFTSCFFPFPLTTIPSSASLVFYMTLDALIGWDRQVPATRTTDGEVVFRSHDRDLTENRLDAERVFISGASCSPRLFRLFAPSGVVLATTALDLPLRN